MRARKARRRLSRGRLAGTPLIAPRSNKRITASSAGAISAVFLPLLLAKGEPGAPAALFKGTAVADGKHLAFL